MNRDPNELSHWFPKIEAAGLPIPRTIQLSMSDDCMKDLFNVLDGEAPGPAFQPFVDLLKEATDNIGYPCFLRTGQTSAKHDWRDTCYVSGPENLARHIFKIVEFSETADFMGLPWRHWAVREYLPIRPVTICPRYKDMPVCREFRFFVDDGKVQCWHPYWPKKALRRGGAESVDLDFLYRMDDEGHLRALAERAGAAVGGSWSVDLLETARGWFVTDMAVAAQSYHWPGCPNSDMSAGEARDEDDDDFVSELIERKDK